MNEVPRIKLQKLRALRSRLAWSFQGISFIDMSNLEQLSKRIESIFGEDSPPLQYIRDTLAQYAGKNLTTDNTRLLCCQLAARQDALYNGPLPNFIMVCPEWTAFEVLVSKACIWNDGEPGHEFRLLALTGMVAGSVFHRKFPDRWLNGLAYRLGFSRRTPYNTEGSIFTGFQFWGYITPSERDNRQPEFEKIETDAQTKKRNKFLIKTRMRFEYPPKDDEDACPEHFEYECLECTNTRCEASYNRELHA